MFVFPVMTKKKEGSLHVAFREPVEISHAQTTLFPGPTKLYRIVYKSPTSSNVDKSPSIRPGICLSPRQYNLPFWWSQTQATEGTLEAGPRKGKRRCNVVVCVRSLLSFQKTV